MLSWGALPFLPHPPSLCLRSKNSPALLDNQVMVTFLLLMIYVQTREHPQILQVMCLQSIQGSKLHHKQRIFCHPSSEAAAAAPGPGHFPGMWESPGKHHSQEEPSCTCQDKKLWHKTGKTSRPQNSNAELGRSKFNPTGFFWEGKMVSKRTRWAALYPPMPAGTELVLLLQTKLWQPCLPPNLATPAPSITTESQNILVWEGPTGTH